MQLRKMQVCAEGLSLVPAPCWSLYYIPKMDLSGQALPLHNARRTLPLHLRPFQTSGSGSGDITIPSFLSESIGDQGLTFIEILP